MNTKNHFYLVLLFLIFLFNSRLYAADLTFSSPESKVSLIELYTSEGCSSCPPADKWLGKFSDSELLWDKVVPVAFHVDYWDYLGWKDKFADRRYSQRQYTYQNLKLVSTVYTPGVMKNGREWRAWRWWNSSPESDPNEKPGVLSATLRDNQLSAVYHGPRENSAQYQLNVAMLGTNIKSRVSAGENQGETFSHDFIVLNFEEYLETDSNASISWEINSKMFKTNRDANAIAIWVSTRDNPTPIQATGTWLNQ